ncbi:MAG: hypothetical protein JXP73_11255 [Deltaproteobacteria bacterium]|nr:hypothetical protein [Deltaproteobacteria bacterium]
MSRVLWLFLLGAPAALAQPATSTTGGPAPTVAPAPQPAPVPAAPAAEQHKPTISGPQMLEQGRDYRKEIENIRLQIQTQVEQAKADKDVIRLNCLLDKLTQLNANAKILDQALQSLQEAIVRRDDNAQFHEYTRVTIVHQKAQVLRTEADACVGAETNYVGPTRVVVETPPGLQESVDQPPPPAPPVAVVDRPPAASPYR